MSKIITSEVEANIDALSYYYNKQLTIKKLYEAITNKYNEIYKLHEKIEKINREIEQELYGYYSEVFKFNYKDGKYDIENAIIKKKEGRLEKLKEYLNEKNEKIAINKYLKTLGAIIRKEEISNIDNLLCIEDNLDIN